MANGFVNIGVGCVVTGWDLTTSDRVWLGTSIDITVSFEPSLLLCPISDRPLYLCPELLLALYYQNPHSPHW